MTNKYKQNSVSQAIWPWQENTSPGKPGKPSLVVSLSSLAIAWIIAGFFYYFNHPTLAVIVICISSFVFFCGQFLPKIYGLIENLFQKLSYYIGLALTWLTLVPFFYLCFGGGRIIQKMTGKDPMKRNIDNLATSYWHERKKEVEIEQYRKQF